MKPRREVGHGEKGGHFAFSRASMSAGGQPASSQSAGWFGHSSIAVTMDIYSHLMPDMQEDAAAKVDPALVETINRSRAK